MKGVIFNLLERAVTDEYGEDAWEQLLVEAGLDGAYTSVGTYPHEELLALVAAASGQLDVARDDLLRWFGRSAMPLLAERYAELFEAHTSLESFMLSLNDIIHPEVRKLFPGAYAPEFEFDTSAPGVISLGYQSHRNLCLFAEGLVQGAADRFGASVSISQSECTLRGGSRCVLVCEIGAAP